MLRSNRATLAKPVNTVISTFNLEIAMKLLKLFMFLSLLLSNEAYSLDAPVRGAKVTYAGTYGNGDVYVAIDRTINEPGCAQPRFDVPSQLPNSKQILATAYMAMATGKTIGVFTKGCYGGYPTLDNSRGTWFLVLQ